MTDCAPHLLFATLATFVTSAHDPAYVVWQSFVVLMRGLAGCCLRAQLSPAKANMHAVTKLLVGGLSC